MRAAIYARYSSDLQRPTSIEEPTHRVLLQFVENDAFENKRRKPVMAKRHALLSALRRVELSGSTFHSQEGQA